MTARLATEEVRTSGTAAGGRGWIDSERLEEAEPGADASIAAEASSTGVSDAFEETTSGA
jgi:hypothetical protein